jgi:hypothetical protein
MQTGAVVFGGAWGGWGWFPGEISDGPKDEEFAKSRFQFAMPNSRCCLQVRSSKLSP